MANEDKNVEDLSPEMLIVEVDNAQEQIAAYEGTKPFQKYLAAKIFLETCSAKLKERALTFGDFRSKYFNFQKVDKETTDWKAVCRHLLDLNLVKSKDMESAIEAFTEKKPYAKMVRVKDKDISLKLS